MPNTLAHLGINGFVTRKLLNKSDLYWVLIGSIIPDFPWITKKILSVFAPSLISYNLQSYLIIQASFFFCFIISLGIAKLSNHYRKTIITLLLGSLLHLFLDSLQTKWANGIHLFAPFDWEQINIGLFWPESLWSYSLTLIGILFLIMNYRSLLSMNIPLKLNLKNSLVFTICLIIYFILPFLFIQYIENNNCHFITTLKYENNRIGNYVEMDRKNIVYDCESRSYWIESFDGSLIKLETNSFFTSDRISIKGEFIGRNVIQVYDYHANWSLYRDGASYIGLSIILLTTLNGFYKKHLHKNNDY